MKGKLMSALFLLSLIISVSKVQAQDVEGCYMGYYNVFNERGASAVPNGEHDVVISIIRDGKSTCYFGKAKVQNGSFQSPVMIQKDDMSYVPLNTVFRSLDQDWLGRQDLETLYEVHDGMSKMFYAEDGMSGRLFFYTFIHDKPRANRRAPSADVLIKR
ncbi:hypothetical protein [Cecembia lonarensis]|uniref:DUF4488 domain-containing protein n=1 Tax=Cecembia lonarensis (strain CCUG 58316 / KCTC 22772 / LW9) TaxID=1225176 RepID=K1KXY3_CECL9|nr:hypothetical protein [Cecembia lonarensis]EKB47331.1 hypothetical protein B879_04069 [Cecembia lonarensis LW9]